MARFVDGDPHLVAAVASPRSKGKDKRSLECWRASRACPKRSPLPSGRCRREKVAPLSLFHGPTKLGVSGRGYNIVADHRARADTVPGDRGSRAEQASATLEEERMATEPTGSMPEGMQGNGSPTELPSIPTDNAAKVGAQERVRAVAGTASG